MGPTDPSARRCFAGGFARGPLHHPRREKRPTGITVKPIRHLRAELTLEEPRAPEASKRRVKARRKAGPPAMAAAPAAVPVV